MPPPVDVLEAPPPGHRAPRVRMSGPKRREHLIGVALHLFATKGFRGTTTRDIARAAGVSEGSIFRQFPTKEALYTAILEHKARKQGVQATMASLRRHIGQGDDDAVVAQLATTVFDSFRGDVDFQRLMLLAALEGHGLARVSRRILGLPFFDLLRDYVAERQKSGAFRAGDPALLAVSLVALPLYFAMVTQLFGLEAVGPADRKVATTFSTLILDGLRPHGGARAPACHASGAVPPGKPPGRRTNGRQEKRN